MYLKSAPSAVECHSAAIPSSSTPSSYPHTPGCAVVITAPVGHILITVAAIAREGESCAITPCAPDTRTANPLDPDTLKSTKSPGATVTFPDAVHADPDATEQASVVFAMLPGVPCRRVTVLVP